MSEEIKVAVEPEKPGAALARKRWERTTPAERAAVVKMLNRARLRKRAKRGGHQTRKASK